MKFSTKKLICALLIFVMTLSLASCNKDEEGFYIEGNSSITIQVNETYLLTAVKPDNAKGKIQWESSNEAIAVVADGAVVGVASGVAVITASLGDYSDKVIVTVSTPKDNNNTGNNGGTTGGNTTGGNTTGGNTTGGNTTGGNTSGGNTTGGNTGTTQSIIGSIDFTSTTQRTSQDANSQVWKNGTTTFTNNKASSQNDVANYSNPVRLYPNSEVVIECTGMTKIVFLCGTYNDKDYPAALQLVDFGSNATVTVNDLYVTVTFSAPVNSITVSIVNQVRLMSVEIYGSN